MLKAAISWASTLVDLSTEEKTTIMHSRRAFLFSQEGAWMKRENSTFDITMGSLDGAECCEVVGLYILHRLADIIPMVDCGLYRDDGLAMVRGSGPQVERLRKDLVKVFLEMELKVTVEANLTITDFLDITFNLVEGTHSPYSKAGNTIKYVAADSNHPPHIKKAIPKMLAARLSKLSSTEEIFMKEM